MPLTLARCLRLRCFISSDTDGRPAKHNLNWNTEVGDVDYFGALRFAWKNAHGGIRNLIYLLPARSVADWVQHVFNLLDNAAAFIFALICGVGPITRTVFSVLFLASQPCAASYTRLWV